MRSDPSGLDVQLPNLYRGLLRGWPLMFALGVIGGVAGSWLAVRLPVVYQATAQIQVGIDQGRSEWLDEDAQDQVMFRVQSLLLSDQTLERAAAALTRPTDGPALPANAVDFRRHISLTRIESNWQLTGRGPTPESAAQLANAWAQAGLDESSIAIAAATITGELESLFFSVYCKPGQVTGAGDRLWACDEKIPGGDAADLPQDVIQAAADSRGLIPPMSTSLDQLAEPPAGPITSTRGALVASGTVLGLLMGVIWAIACPDRFQIGARVRGIDRATRTTNDLEDGPD